MEIIHIFCELTTLKLSAVLLGRCNQLTRMNYLLKRSFVLFLFFVLACSEQKIEEEEAVQNNQLAQNQYTQVKTSSATKGTFYYYVSANGKFEAPRDQEILAEAGGRIAKLYIQEGMRVKSGQLLMQLDDREAQLKVRKAEIALESAKLNFENEMLGSPGLSERVDENAAAIKARIMVSGGVSAAEVDLESARLELERHRLNAAYDGVITDLKVSEKEYINAGKEICSIYENGFMYLKAKVLENDIGMIEVSMPVKVKAAALDYELEGTVESINRRVDENGMCAVNIRVDSKAIIPGMSAVAEVKIPKQSRLMVPKDAVVIRSGRPVVFTVENNIARWNYVKTGLDNGREVEILEGIEEGAIVITTNNLQLAHDAPVAIERE